MICKFFNVMLLIAGLIGGCVERTGILGSIEKRHLENKGFAQSVGSRRCGEQATLEKRFDRGTRYVQTVHLLPRQYAATRRDEGSNDLLFVCAQCLVECASALDD